MKKEVLIMSVLILGLSLKSFASTGNANDGLVFILAVVGFLLIIAGLLKGIDYLRRNSKQIINNAMRFLKRMSATLRVYLKKAKSEYFDLSYF
jgi:hypothetical protein